MRFYACFTLLFVGSSAFKIKYIPSPFGKSYYYSPVSRTFAEANDFCVHQGSSLVRIGHLLQQDYVRHIVGKSKGFWISAKNVLNSKTFKWAGGDTIEWFNWKPGMPANSGATCLGIMVNSDDLWYDISCASAYYTVCERPMLDFEDVNETLIAFGERLHHLEMENYALNSSLELAKSNTDDVRFEMNEMFYEQVREAEKMFKNSNASYADRMARLFEGVLKLEATLIGNISAISNSHSTTNETLLIAIDESSKEMSHLRSNLFVAETVAACVTVAFVFSLIALIMHFKKKLNEILDQLDDHIKLT